MVVEDAAIAAKYLIKTNYIFKVVNFHPETQTVDVVQDVFEFTNRVDGEFIMNNECGGDGSAAVIEPDYIPEIPVLQLRWGQFEIQCCPKPGDTGILAVFTNDIRNWVQEGGPSIPNTDNHFMKNSCVFIPFVPNKTSCANDYPADNNSLVIKSANAKIVLTDDGTTSSITAEAKTMEVKAEDGVNITGDVNVTGKISATEDIKSDGEVTAGTVKLSDHKHGVGTLKVPSTSPEGSPSTITGSTDTPV